jgi:PAS domain S-box-containing protein
MPGERAGSGNAGWVHQYAQLLSQVVAGAGDEFLVRAAEFGRTLAEAHVPPEDIAAEHMRLLGELTAGVARPAVEVVAAVTPLYVHVTAAHSAQLAAQAARLAHSEQRYREMLDNSRDVVYRVNLRDLSIEYMSPSCESLTGYTPEELVQLGREGILERLVHPEDRLGFRFGPNGEVPHAVGGAGTFTAEFRVRHRDGDYRWCSVTRAVVRDAAGAVVAGVGIVQDITDRKRTEEELRHYRADLERLVVERTGELAGANDQLQQELAERQRVEAALRASEERFRQLAENIHQAFWLSEPHTRRMLYIGAAYEEIWNRPCAGLYADPGVWLEAVHPDDRDKALQSLEDQSRGRQTDLELRILRPDGTVRWIRNQGFPVCNATGQVYRVAGIAEDITERKQTEQLLLVQRDVGLALASTDDLQELLTQVLETACRIDEVDCGGIYLMDAANGNLELAVHANISPEFAVAAAQISPESPHVQAILAGQPIYGARVALEPRGGELAREGMTCVGVIPVRHQGRVLASLHLASRTVSEFSVSTRRGIESIAASIGAAVARIRAEQALRTSEERYRLLADSMEDFVSLNDRNGRRLYVSPSFYRATGYTPEEIEHTDFRLRVHPGDLARIEQARADNLGGQQTRTEYRFRCRDGAYVWLEIQATPLRGANGEVEKILCCSRNIADRKAAEEALRGREAILAAVAESAERLLRTWAWQDEVPDMLRRLGEAAQVSRAYVFANQRAPDGTLLTGERYEWAAPGIPQQIDNPHNQNIPYIASGFERWVVVLQRREPIHGNVATFPASERVVLEDRGIRAQVVVPVFVGDDWWGFIGFADCVREREWTLPEVEALKVAASTLGEAIYRQQAEEALRASEERFRTLSTTAPVGIFLSDDSAGCLYVNPRLAEICGLAPAECFGLGWLQTVHPEDRENVWVAMQSTLRARQEFTLEFRLLRRDGQERWVHVHTARVLSPGGALQMRVGIIEDTTERKHADQTLRESEERYRLLAENATDLIVRVAVDGTTSYVSPACRALTGYSPEELLGRNAFELFHEEDEAAMRAWHERVLQAADSQTAEYQLRRKDGSFAWCEATARARRDALTGTVLEVIAVVRDITDRKRAEENARRHLEQMAHVARVSSLGEMVSGLAHELAQPLSAILYYARGARTQLLDGVWGVSQAADTLQKVAGQAERAGQFIRGLKAFVRKVPPSRVPTDLNAVVRDALGFVTPLARQQQVAIQLDFGENLPLVLVERIPIEQVIVNLMNNGIDAVQSRPAAARHLWVRTYVRADGAVCVTVRDAGPGLTPEVAAHVFDPFFTTKQRGTGLGLSISRTIVEDTHAGEMWLEPNPGGGALFGFALPVAAGSSPGAAAPDQG